MVASFGDDLRSRRPLAGAQPVEVERNAGVEMDPVEDAPQRGRRWVEPVAIRADAIRQSTSDEPGGAVLEFVQRFCVGGDGIGMVEALQHLPRRSGRTARDRLRVRARG